MLGSEFGVESSTLVVSTEMVQQHGVFFFDYESATSSLMPDIFADVRNRGPKHAAQTHSPQVRHKGID